MNASRVQGCRLSPARAALAAGTLVVAVLWSVTAFGAGLSDPAVQDVASGLNDIGGFGAMTKGVGSALAIALIGLPLILPVLVLVWVYNGLVDREERVHAAWAQVESNVQRRSDLIPPLVQTVSRYLQHERETLREITAERAGSLDPLGQALQDVVEAEKRASELGEGAAPQRETLLERLAAAEVELDRALGRLFAVAESYPQLRSADQFLELQGQLEGTENRINLARVEFNRMAEDYNAAIRRLPGSLIAGLGDFRRKAYFKAADGTGRPAELSFE
jgi:LemA protein